VGKQKGIATSALSRYQIFVTGKCGVGYVPEIFEEFFQKFFKLFSGK
jgi:hypothetical protein